MSKLQQVRAEIQQVDLTILVIVEMLRGNQHRATPGNVQQHISGAPLRGVFAVLKKNADLGTVEWRQDLSSYALTDLGEQLLLEDVGSWQPAKLERIRRENEMLARTASSN